MKILGLAGGIRRIHEPSGPASGLYTHDGAAVLVDAGRVVAACEQERVDRIKHSDKAPVEAIQRVLELAGERIEAVDRIAFYSSEAGLDRALAMARVRQGEPIGDGARATLAKVLSSGLGVAVDPARFTFVKHHLAHAASAFGMSGFDDALVVTFDGIGEDESGIVGVARGGKIEVLWSIPPAASLGQLYCDVIAFLGYGLFDEYKVMGLAPYGDASRYRDLFRGLYTLLPEGRHEIHSERIFGVGELGPVRRRGEAFTQVHMDIAAALQEALSALVFHVLRHARAVTGMARLCLAGGVAHNCTVNGELLRSGLFEHIFVQPAAHDAGCALGAALALCLSSRIPITADDRLYWGTDATADDAAVARTLAAWGDFVVAERKDDVVGHAAERLAAGEVIGWVQGRAEFGPRALGNRSIVADPRPAENKKIINAMVKKREGYRPFAPSVAAEACSRFFEVPEGLALPHMIFVVGVREEHRKALGAITHVDGSARVQTVSREQNPRYWALLQAFGERTGVPMVLNTSFNNHAEPIVDSVEDAIVCFLTTDLHALAIGDHWVVKKKPDPAAWGRLVPSLVGHAALEKITRVTPSGPPSTTASLVLNHEPDAITPLSLPLFDLLAQADGRTPLASLPGAPAVLDELLGLWTNRHIRLRPPSG